MKSERFLEGQIMLGFVRPSENLAFMLSEVGTIDGIWTKLQHNLTIQENI